MNTVDQPILHSWHAIVRGDTQAFAAFVDQHKNLITSIAYSITGDLSGSEDIAQETFLVSWQSRHELSDPGKLVGWLTAIARNLAKQWLRKRSAKSWGSEGLDDANIAQNETDPSERLVSVEEQQLVWSALESIPENYREVMILYYRESHSVEDVALALDITEEAARQRLSRGRNLLRAEVERTIENALSKSRPSSQFTAGVISLITVGSGSALGKAVTTSALGAIGKVATQSTLVGATQTVASGAMLGAAGGLLGAMGGLAGAWLGNRVPQLLAPTMTERNLLEREGRFIWRLAMLFTFFTIVSVVLAIWQSDRPNAVMIAVLVNVIAAVIFATVSIARGIRINRQVQRIRATVSPEQDPNPTWLKDRIGVTHEPSKSKWIGRRATSEQRLLGWPLYEFQVSDPTISPTSSGPLHAKAWFAVGDKATGLVAIGSVARGFIAIGGLSLGVISLGGFSIGLLSIGGAALGLLSIGGIAGGHSAIGGGAVGWQAAGGGALGVYSANGGLAIAGTIAEGGLALSMKYAVGGEARAPQANTAAAREACDKSWVAGYLSTPSIVNKPDEFRRQTLIYGTFVSVAFPVILAIAVPALMYRRPTKKESEDV